MAILCVLADTLLAVQKETVRHYAAVDVKTLAGVVEINQGAPACFGNHLQRALHHLVAVAQRGAKDVTRKTVGVYTDQDRLGVDVGVDIAPDEGQMALSPINLALISNHAKVSEASRHDGFGDAEDVALVLQTEAD